ncbi:hypothetical protein P4O66_009064, partial [Electrophorus voltai]
MTERGDNGVLRKRADARGIPRDTSTCRRCGSVAAPARVTGTLADPPARSQLGEERRFVTGRGGSCRRSFSLSTLSGDGPRATFSASATQKRNRLKARAHADEQVLTATARAARAPVAARHFPAQSVLLPELPTESRLTRSLLGGRGVRNVPAVRSHFTQSRMKLLSATLAWEVPPNDAPIGQHGGPGCRDVVQHLSSPGKAKVPALVKNRADK